MLNKPQWKQSFHVEILEPENVCLLTETGYTVLTGCTYCLLAPLLNGQHTTEELISLLADKVSIPEIYYALHLLERDGHIIESEESPTEIAAFWHTLGIDTKTVFHRLQNISVSVRSFGDVNTAPLVDILQSLNIQVVEDGDVEIVLTDDYLQSELEELNQQALSKNRPWVLVKPIGTKIWLGPYFQPGKTACFKCMSQRLQANRQMESYLLKQKNTSKPLITSRAALPNTQQIALQMVALQIAKILVLNQNDTLENSIVVFDTLSLDCEKHTLVRRPQCSACGNSSYHNISKPIVLQSQKKAFTRDGGHRIALPEDTLKTYQHHISPITGVVSSLFRTSEDNDELVHSYNAGHNFALMNNSLFFLLKNLRGRSGGKGMTDIQAKVSGLCEAIERYSGVFWGDEISKKATYQEIEAIALHPNSLMLFSSEQYKNRINWNHAHDSAYHRVPLPFDESRKIAWTPVWSLTNHQFRYVPTAYCYYGHPDLKESFFCTCDANGNAAGNTIEEAILQGLMELTERDSVAIWWYNRVQRPAVDLSSFNDTYFDSLQSFYQSIHRDIWVIDITSNLGIPAFAAISRRTDKPIEDIVLGFGAHLDPKLAVMRALTEVNQFLPAVRRSTEHGETLYWFDDAEAVQWWKTATIAEHSYLLPNSNIGSKKLSDYAQLCSDDLLNDVQTCVDLLSKQGMETLVLDQTRPDIGLNVVKVMVPGLRHFWKRFGNGRLYDIPVSLGWLPKPLTESQLNPIGIFF